MRQLTHGEQELFMIYYDEGWSGLADGQRQQLHVLAISLLDVARVEGMTARATLDVAELEWAEESDPIRKQLLESRLVNARYRAELVEADDRCLVEMLRTRRQVEREEIANEFFGGDDSGPMFWNFDADDPALAYIGDDE